MKDVTAQNFGYLLAYVLPGFLLLLIVDQSWPGMQPWLDASTRWATTPTVGGFLYVTLASVAAGVTVSTVRWLVVDWLHHHTGIPPPQWDDSRLQERLSAFEALVDAHYRYYQFYANSLVCLVATLTGRVLSGRVGLVDVTLALLCGLFWVGSRDTLRRYYRRTEVLLGGFEQGAAHDERTSPEEESRASRSTRASRRAGRRSPCGHGAPGLGRKGAGVGGRAAGRGHEL